MKKDYIATVNVFMTSGEYIKDVSIKVTLKSVRQCEDYDVYRAIKNMEYIYIENLRMFIDPKHIEVVNIIQII